MSDDSQDQQINLDQAVRRLFDQCATTPEQGTTVFAVCLTLVEELAREQPTVVRQAWANKLYQLADILAAETEGE